MSKVFARDLFTAIVFEAEFASLYGKNGWYMADDQPSALRQIHLRSLAFEGARVRLGFMVSGRHSDDTK